MTLIEKIQHALDLSGNVHSIHDVLDAVEEGRARMWFSPRSILVAEIVPYPQRRVLNMWIAAGDLQEVLGWAPLAYQWGKEEGCDSATMLGRKGWARVLADDGWTVEPLVTLSREL